MVVFNSDKPKPPTTKKEIDWSKPVEYECYGIVRPIHATFIADGIRYAVVEGRHGYHVQNVANISGGTLRNVRRKVRYERWITFKKNGDVNVYEFDPREADKIFMADVVDLRWFEWESDADE